MPNPPQDTFEKRQRQRKKQDARADKAYRRSLRREERQHRAGDSEAEKGAPIVELPKEDDGRDDENGPTGGVNPNTGS